MVCMCGMGCCDVMCRVPYAENLLRIVLEGDTVRIVCSPFGVDVYLNTGVSNGSFVCLSDVHGVNIVCLCHVRACVCVSACQSAIVLTLHIGRHGSVQTFLSWSPS